MRATMTIRGLWYYDHSIFDEFEIPKELNKDYLINNLIIELDDFEILYPDPRVMKSIIGAWSRIECPKWLELWETTQYEYNPIDNYNRHEEFNDDYGEEGNAIHTVNKNGESGKKVITTGDNNTTYSATNDRTETPGVTTTTSNYVTGYNSTLETLHDKQVTNTTGKNTIHDSNGGHDYLDYSDNRDTSADYTDTENGTNKETKISANRHTGHAWGNIGVTTTQVMIKQQREIVEFNIYDYIISDFKRRFCLMIY